MGISNKKTLYERIGGDAFIIELTNTFFDEMVENDEVGHFFKHISMSALKYHCVKFFRVVLGPEDEKPEIGDLMDFLLQTHSRVFREMDLDDDHFDEVSDSLEQALRQYKVEKSMADEVMTIWNSTKDIFLYGSKVAKLEKTMTPEQLKSLPPACYKTMGTDTPVSLPAYSQIDVPDWLSAEIEKAHVHTEVRAWTCDMTDRFGPEGDNEIAKTVMCQPYMAHHVYCTAFLGLAFMPENVDPKKRLELLEIVIYPRGRNHSPLSQALYERMIDQFGVTCDRMGLPQYEKKAAVTQLNSFQSAFAKKTTKADGINAPHLLCRSKAAALSTSKKAKKESSSKPKKIDNTSVEDSDDTADDSTSMSNSASQSKSSRSGRASGGGWLNFFAGQKKVMHVVR